MLTIIESLIVFNGLHNLLALLNEKAIVLFQIYPEHCHFLPEPNKSLLRTTDFNHEIIDLLLVFREKLM